MVNLTISFRYLVYPSANTTGIVDHHFALGQHFKKGDVLATVRSLDGAFLKTISAEMDGFIIGWFNGIAKYEGQAFGFIGVVDAPTRTVVPWEDLDRAEERDASIA